MLRFLRCNYNSKHNRRDIKGYYTINMRVKCRLFSSAASPETWLLLSLWFIYHAFMRHCENYKIRLFPNITKIFIFLLAQRNAETQFFLIPIMSDSQQYTQYLCLSNNEKIEKVYNYDNFLHCIFTLKQKTLRYFRKETKIKH